MSLNMKTESRAYVKFVAMVGSLKMMQALGQMATKNLTELKLHSYGYMKFCYRVLFCIGGDLTVDQAGL